jgi:predicted RND superfamily exporter protein
MERFIKWLDDVDDLRVVFRVTAPSVLLTLALVATFVVALGAMFLLGPPDLLASP